MSKFIPKEINPFKMFSPPEINIPPVPEPEPTFTPPPAGATRNVTADRQDLQRRGGFRSNLMTGGLGLGASNPANILRRVLGNKLGTNNG